MKLVARVIGLAWLHLCHLNELTKSIRLVPFKTESWGPPLFQPLMLVSAAAFIFCSNLAGIQNERFRIGRKKTSAAAPIKPRQFGRSADRPRCVSVASELELAAATNVVVNFKFTLVELNNVHSVAKRCCPISREKTKGKVFWSFNQQRKFLNQNCCHRSELSAASLFRSDKLVWKLNFDIF